MDCPINVNINGLSGRYNPVLRNISTTYEVDRARIHIKMLSSVDYLCQANLSLEDNSDPSCRLCKTLTPHSSVPSETMDHVLTKCKATVEARSRLFPDLFNVITTPIST